MGSIPTVSIFGSGCVCFSTGRTCAKVYLFFAQNEKLEYVGESLRGSPRHSPRGFFTLTFFGLTRTTLARTLIPTALSSGLLFTNILYVPSSRIIDDLRRLH